MRLKTNLNGQGGVSSLALSSPEALVVIMDGTELDSTRVSSVGVSKVRKGELDRGCRPLTKEEGDRTWDLTPRTWTQPRAAERYSETDVPRRTHVS